MRISFMRWRPGSDGREPRERRKWLEINGVPSRVRFRMFIRNRLWIGLPPAFVAGFGVVLLLLVSGGESTPERSFGAGVDRRRFMRIRLDIGRLGRNGTRFGAGGRKLGTGFRGSVCSPRVAMVAVGSFAVGLRYAMPSFLRVSDGSSKANARCWRVRRKSSVKY